MLQESGGSSGDCSNNNVVMSFFLSPLSLVSLFSRRYFTIINIPLDVAERLCGQTFKFHPYSWQLLPYMWPYCAHEGEAYQQSMIEIG